jgi:hypothetical protein
MIKEPTVLIRSTLEWSHANGETYRLVAIPVDETHGYDGIDFRVEELRGIDAMGVERWEEPEHGCHSMVVAAFAQQMLKDKLNVDEQ